MIVTFQYYAIRNKKVPLASPIRERAGQRRISDQSLVKALAEGEILESYPSDPRGPSALVLGYTNDGRAIHAVCAFDPAGILLVITAYLPELLGLMRSGARSH